MYYTYKILKVLLIMCKEIKEIADQQNNLYYTAIYSSAASMVVSSFLTELQIFGPKHAIKLSEDTCTCTCCYVTVVQYKRERYQLRRSTITDTICKYILFFYMPMKFTEIMHMQTSQKKTKHQEKQHSNNTMKLKYCQILITYMENTV